MNHHRCANIIDHREFVVCNVKKSPLQPRTLFTTILGRFTLVRLFKVTSHSCRPVVWQTLWLHQALVLLRVKVQKSTLLHYRSHLLLLLSVRAEENCLTQRNSHKDVLFWGLWDSFGYQTFSDAVWKILCTFKHWWDETEIPANTTGALVLKEPWRELHFKTHINEKK